MLHNFAVFPSYKFHRDLAIIRSAMIFDLSDTEIQGSYNACCLTVITRLFINGKGDCLYVLFSHRTTWEKFVSTSAKARLQHSRHRVKERNAEKGRTDCKAHHAEYVLN